MQAFLFNSLTKRLPVTVNLSVFLIAVPSRGTQRHYTTTFSSIITLTERYVADNHVSISFPRRKVAF